MMQVISERCIRLRSGIGHPDRVPIALASAALLVSLSGCVRTIEVDVVDIAVAESGVCDSRYSDLQKSRCLWVAKDESVGMQWDMGLCFRIDGSPPRLGKQNPPHPPPKSHNAHQLCPH